jgi:hypothetical protein
MRTERSQGGVAMQFAPLGVMEGEVLAYIDRYGPTPFQTVLKELRGPAPRIAKAVALLIGQGVLRGFLRNDTLYLEPVS